MNSNELRIGNWVQVHKPIKVTGEIIASWEGLEKQKQKIIIGGLQPIPLTQEILEKCGGYVSGDFMLISHKEMNLICIQFYAGEAYIETDGCQCSKPIKYLHQLQNLYFALTGEELDISL